MSTRSFVVSLLAVLLFPTLRPRATACPGDLNEDGQLSGGDIQQFSIAWILGPDVTPESAAADIDGNGVLNEGDVASFVELLLAVRIAGSLEVEWIHGSHNCQLDPGGAPLQVHEYNSDTFIIRQSKCTNFEAPFLYLLFGQDRVLLQDTGASAAPGAFPIQCAVQAVIDQWLARNNKSSIDLIVTHSHSHSDHIANDAQFIGQPNTTVVGTSLAAVQAFFGFTNWPTQIVTYDLGGRVLDIIPSPGHHPTQIILYDRQTDWLLTSDTLYPGFLFIFNFTQYADSIARLVEFADCNPISYCMGNHVEMTAVPGVAYPYGTVFQPNEHVLQLEVSHLIELNDAIQAMGGAPSFEIHDDFIITPL